MLVPEVAATREHHRRAGIAHCCDDLVVALRSARLDDCRNACGESGLGAVGEREERVGGKDGASDIVPVGARFLECEVDGIDARRLTAADPDRREILCDLLRHL